MAAVRASVSPFLNLFFSLSLFPLLVTVTTADVELVPTELAAVQV